MEEDVKEQIAEWEKKHKKSFLVGGVRFTEFIAKQWLEYQQNKENEKNQRVSIKTAVALCLHGVHFHLLYYIPRHITVNLPTLFQFHSNSIKYISRQYCLIIIIHS